jgi:hypothetical protein
MENSKTQEKIIRLGKLLVAELEQEPGTDFLCRWIAHYLAEQITLAESAKGRKKIAARRACFETILTLWKHRASLPNGRRPFEKFEPVLHALRSLDPSNPEPYYHRLKLAEKDADPKDVKLVSQLIDLIFAVDSAARVVIDTVLNELTKIATTPRTKLILKNAPRAAKNNSIQPFQLLIEKLDTEKLEQIGKNPNAVDSLNEERLKRLREFRDLCKRLERLLEKRIQKISGVSVKLNEHKIIKS